MRAHGERMDACIRATGSVHRDLLTGNSPGRFLDRLLYARPVRLPLPAHEGAAVIFDRQRKPAHDSSVPAGMGKPRSRSAAGMAPRPAR